jgi:hypothetical protein
MTSKLKCIFCPNEETDSPEEHIVPESLGNTTYILTNATICREHNTLFSKFEEKALSKTILGMERSRLGVKTKKGKPAKSKTGDIEFMGDKDFRKNVINVNGLKDEDIKDFDPKTGTFKIVVQGFDKTEVPTGKLVLKIGIESIFQSQKQLTEKYDFQDLKDCLTNKNNKDWPFLITKKRLTSFKSIPKYNDKHELKKIRCELLFSELNSNTLLFNFVYGGVSILMNLINRDKSWTDDYLKDRDAELYPINMRPKT